MAEKQFVQPLVRVLYKIILSKIVLQDGVLHGGEHEADILRICNAIASAVIGNGDENT